MSAKITRNKMTPSLDKISSALDQVPKQAYDFFVKTTPKDSGNARSKTKLQGSKIVAAYPYARRLDKGYSRQAPNGMVEPTKRFVKSLLKNKIRK